MNNRIFQEDIKTFTTIFPLRDEVRDTTFLITGATGLLGSIMVRCLLALNCGIKIITPVRNIEKAKAILPDSENLIIRKYDIYHENFIDYKDIDYVIHGAAPTASKTFVENPVETIESIYCGTRNILKFCNSKRIKSMTFLSSLEVYGNIISDLAITENMQGEIDILNVRSSYPLGKRIAENLCISYCKEYGVPVKIIRLTQVTGAGIAKNDNRVFAQYVRLATNGEDIILHTTGESARPYIYTIDAINAILFVLLKGENGTAYNAANETTYISAYNLADIVKSTLDADINIKIELNDTMGYAPVSKLPLSSNRLNSLGWTAIYPLEDIIKRMSQYLREQSNE